MALRAYPDPEPTPVQPSNPALDAEFDRIAAANAQNAQNLLFSQSAGKSDLKVF